MTRLSRFDWKSAAKTVLQDAPLRVHLLNLLLIPVYPVLWLAVYLWLPERYRPKSRK